VPDPAFRCRMHEASDVHGGPSRVLGPD